MSIPKIQSKEADESQGVFAVTSTPVKSSNSLTGKSDNSPTAGSGSGAPRPKKLPPLYTAALPAKDPNQREPGVLPIEKVTKRLRHSNRVLHIENAAKVKMGYQGQDGLGRNYLYLHGRSMDVPKAVHEWLCSDPAAEEMMFDASIFEPLD
ncbi:uncharacterized protein CC84DRAFT_1180600 [Paraphaeosphaeria sporulosa]|uniref:Uncharacterized protein n=1 Tax=Paraphaeosphaeria sporulosa TaxID=1460663 RepID=A0A177C1K9_9PLEO|nr:uncharacterized protein CC84DRAFT_1180600 [Paraphaeosphaeria sporulosa]OAG00607.1 hypothetical protein CC84DRAFT_1180600 [Paraphaeosphaeria sporulosa]